MPAPAGPARRSPCQPSSPWVCWNWTASCPKCWIAPAAFRCRCRAMARPGCGWCRTRPGWGRFSSPASCRPGIPGGPARHVDDVLRGHAAMLERAVAQLALRTDAAVLCRAFILQLLYPVGSRRYFLEQIAYNPVPLVRRPDAGLGADEEADLDRELDLIGRRPEIVQVLHQALDDGLLTPPSWAAQAGSQESGRHRTAPLARGVAGYAANAGLAARVDAVASRSRPTDSIGMTVTPARRPPASGDVRACLSDFLVANYARLIGRLRARLGCEDLASDSLHDAWLRLADGPAPEPGGAAGVVNPAPTCSAWLQHRHRPPARRAVAARGRSRARTGRGRGRRARPSRSRRRVPHCATSFGSGHAAQAAAPCTSTCASKGCRKARRPRAGLSPRIVRRHLRDAGRHMAGMRTGWPVRRRAAQ